MLWMHGTTCFDEKNGKCTIYADRPFFCRLYPMTILEKEGKPVWVTHKKCPASAGINHHAAVEEIEANLTPELSEQIRIASRHTAEFSDEFDLIAPANLG